MMKISAKQSLIVIIFLTILVVALFIINRFNKSPVLPDYGVAPTFVLTDSQGAAFHSSQLSGKPWVASFIFTRCPDQCPIMILKLNALSKKVPDLLFVSFTSDPNFDKPDVLAEYLKRGIGPQNWSFLTGEKNELASVASALMISATDNPSMHSTRFILIDSSNHMRGFYDSQVKEQMDDLALDARDLIDKSSIITSQ